MSEARIAARGGRRQKRKARGHVDRSGVVTFLESSHNRTQVQKNRKTLLTNDPVPWPVSYLFLYLGVK